MNTPPIKVLVLLSRFPYPLEKGDKLRAFQHLKNLSMSGYEVHLVAVSDVEVTALHLAMVSPFCASVEVISLPLATRVMNLARSFVLGLPLQVGYFYSPHAQALIDAKISAVQPNVVYCQLIRMANYLSRDRSSIPAVIDYQDAFSVGTEQRVRTAPWFLRPFYTRELRLVRQFESSSFSWFHKHIIISEQDRSVMTSGGDAMTVLPNGLDADYFSPRSCEKIVDVLFVGNMNYPPNVVAACFLVEKIMPIVWSALPTVSVQIAGATPDRRARSLASERVRVTGWVDDIRTCYASSRVFVAPMQTGTGLQNKLLEAMAMAIPCITTPISAQPLGAVAERDILIGEDAQSIANQMIRLLENADEAQHLGLRGREFIVEKFRMEQTRTALDEAIREALSMHDRGR
ncbi:MAG: glycosyltransferase [Candidatus Kapabacteria bacterium]|nr:glycosyltransferase [Candidatus Kapabacteria bacterium]